MYFFIKMDFSEGHKDVIFSGYSALPVFYGLDYFTSRIGPRP